VFIFNLLVYKYLRFKRLFLCTQRISHQMNKLTKFLFFAALFLSLQVNAQYIPNDSIGTPFDYDRYLATIGKDCPAPSVDAVAVVTTLNNGASVYLRFSNDAQNNAQYRYISDDIDALSSAFTPGDGNATTMTGLPLGKDFTVYAQNACGIEVPIARFSTKTGKKQGGIEVSNSMYSLIVSYQLTTNPIPFPKFLENANIPIMEKVSFIQNYYMDGKPLESWNGIRYIGSDLPPLPVNGDCICEFILNRTKTITPQPDIPENGGGLVEDGSIDPVIVEDGENPLPNATMGHTQWWSVKSSKGAARYHQLWTEGFKAGGANQSWLIDDTNDSMPSYTQSANASLLRYNLFCQNLAYVPEDCACEKPLTMYFGYDSNVHTKAEKRSGGVGPRNAFAAGQDLAAAVFHVDGSNAFKVMRKIDVRHDSRCDRTVNADFWANWTMVAIRSAGAVYALYDSNFTQVDSLILDMATDNFDEALKTAFNTNFWDDNGCSGNGSKTGFMSGDTLVYLKPNQPVTMFIFAYGKLQTGGKRGWHSTARILSNFYLAGYIPGGPLSNQNLNCCSPKIADWIWATMPDAPAGPGTLRTRVSSIFSAFSPWDIADNTTKLTEWGHEVVQVHPDCDMGTDEPGNPLVGGGDERNDNGDNQPDNFRYYLFDQTSRLIWEKETNQSVDNLPAFLQQNGVKVPSGIYLLKQVNKGVSNTKKVFVH
jgi:hypothetical protein